MTNNSKAKASYIIGKTIQITLKNMEREVAGRAYRASNELRSAALHVLRGSRSGRVYRVPGTKKNYKASAPGEAPANRTGVFRMSWGPHIRVEKQGKKYRCVSGIESNVKVGKYLLGDLLENGTGRMEPRPYKDAVKERAMPKIKQIYDAPYNV